ncbi:SCO6880 family protein [Leifsonia sp. McL0607]|uniref:SCO6880 family protein n=1 Tax=Leifsonia sp. McL0607 TaxID=3415672 RepID=UPI003CF7914C
MSLRINYGGWFERKSPGLFRLTLFGTVGLGVGIMLILIVQQRAENWGISGLLAFGLALFELFYGWKYDGKTLARRRAEKRNVARMAKRGENSYVTGAAAALAGSYGGHPMPGVLASTEILHERDGRDTPFDVIHYPLQGLFAVSLRCYPEGRGTNDQDTVDMMVAKYGAWLHDRVSPDEGLVGATVTIDSFQGTGVQLRENVRGNRHPNAPAAASRVMDAVVDELPTGLSDLVGYATLVWRKSAMTVETATDADVVVEIAKRLPGHMDALTAGGAGDPTPMLEPDLVETARLAYKPSDQEAFDELRAREEVVQLRWEDAGPSFLSEPASRKVLHHDGGSSFTLEMRLPPRGTVYENHLLRLLRPSSVFLRKRVTIFYQPVSIEKGQSTAEAAVRAEDFAASQKKGRRTATIARDGRVATALDAQLAEGASLVPFSIMATCTFEDDTESERLARNTLRSLMTSSRMRVREVSGLQAPAFHLTLPFGIVPWEFSDNPIWK